MPVCFWNDPDQTKYRGAYFDTYPGIWRHGDYIEINDYGGVKIYGRSDATLNPGGVRIGTAEIYRQIEQMEEIADSIVVGQNWKNDVRVVLFVQMEPGFELTEILKQKIRQTLRVNVSPRHVPAKIIAVPEIPYTFPHRSKFHWTRQTALVTESCKRTPVFFPNLNIRNHQ